MADEKRAHDHGDPDIADRIVAHEVVVAEKVMLPYDVDDALRPDARSTDTRNRHEAARDEDALGRTVDVA